MTSWPDGSAGNSAAALPTTTSAYIWNVASLPADEEGSLNRYVFAGLTDAAFAAIPLIEAAHRRRWPC